ncbi:hypothetical protein CONLIGDRAFT_649044 [Coniochaeta ligniaria NRRL 30616]|uniref:Uncharacterized protein n=1 Tax=Coniochaeta ligniaria NRRL 30616 TaxID=1408157 RepID=A0A1J7IT73_9PEZI|nr:hypothetical protein CONLIGDRAFT_649044 [Coniochaeta ligniaria NRRL 30616]
MPESMKGTGASLFLSRSRLCWRTSPKVVSDMLYSRLWWSGLFSDKRQANIDRLGIFAIDQTLPINLGSGQHTRRVDTLSLTDLNHVSTLNVTSGFEIVKIMAESSKHPPHHAVPSAPRFYRHRTPLLIQGTREAHAGGHKESLLPKATGQVLPEGTGEAVAEGHKKGLRPEARRFYRVILDSNGSRGKKMGLK